ncbi:MAG: TOBE domain-containing protein, partial [Chloroflexota bacterium]
AVMRAGLVEQVATPSELYARPATRFVATFIGTMNLFDAVVDSGDAVLVGGFRVPLPDGLPLTPGEGIGVGVRPEDFVIGGPEEPGISVDVTHATDLGHYRRMMGDVDGVGPVTVFVDKSREVRLGHQSIWPRRALFYRDETLIGASEAAPLPS